MRLELRQFAAFVRVAWYRQFNRLLHPAEIPESGLEIERYGDSTHHTFRGYYDLDPVSNDATMIAATRAEKRKEAAYDGSLAEVGYFSRGKNQFVSLDTTQSWNWQQGCRLRWFPGNHNALCYNAGRPGKRTSRLLDVKSGTVIQEWNRPLYDVHPCGSKALTLDFEYLHRVRKGYGYPGALNSNTHGDEPGIDIVDLNSGNVERVVSLEDVLKHYETENGSKGIHSFNHLSWSPDGAKFLFFHVEERQEGRRTYMWVGNAVSREIELIESDRNVSHFAWRGATEILATTWSRSEGVVYRLYCLKDSTTHIVQHPFLVSDGHPTYLPGSVVKFVSDRLPDRRGERQLFLFDQESNEVRLLGVFYSPMKMSADYRCDLHPTPVSNMAAVTFDSAHIAGSRNIFIAHI